MMLLHKPARARRPNRRNPSWLFSRGLLQPVGHAHFVLHRHHGGEVLLGLLAIVPAAVKTRNG
jgi:hypothetical protein